MKDLALIILNYNSAKDTIKCVNQLRTFEDDFKIIVVDNCSTDNSLEIIEEQIEFNVTDTVLLKTEKNGGYGYGNNRGIRYAIEHFESHFIGILNPDVWIPSLNVLCTIYSELNKRPEYAIMGGGMLDSSNKYNQVCSGWMIPSAKEQAITHCVLSGGYFKKSRSYRVVDRIAEVECINGCFYIAKAHALQQVGFFDENIFLYNEEAVLGIKMKEAGYKVGFVIGTFFVHNHMYKDLSHQRLQEAFYTTRNLYMSSKYLLKEYHGGKYSRMLSLMECINRVYFSLGWIKRNIKKLIM